VTDSNKNDLYGKLDARSETDIGVPQLIPAATVVLLRDGADGVEALMLKKDSKISFGGMWVFPGGKIDAQDGEEIEDADTVARKAAAREAKEEAGLTLDIQQFHFFSHWTPAPGMKKRFATWFFAVDANHTRQDVQIDDGEIKNHSWINPATALAHHAAGEMQFVPPTWVTLYHLSQHHNVAGFLSHIDEREVGRYVTRVGTSAAGTRIAMWSGDAGYDTWEPDLDGPRHRLVMAKEGFSFINDVVSFN